MAFQHLHPGAANGDSGEATSCTDDACGVGGYQTDKTMTYTFGKGLPKESIRIYLRRVDVQDRMASLPRPGIAPSETYRGFDEPRRRGG
ncbi:MAG: hypothetical protein LUQ25_06405 [Methanoregulaceae archaeon]|nr:hypothetical protein [Methanoregulaceae archaeon]